MEQKSDLAVLLPCQINSPTRHLAGLAGTDRSGFETSAFKAANPGVGKRYGVVTLLRGEGRQGRQPHLWDGRAAQRIVAALEGQLGRQLFRRRGCGW